METMIDLAGKVPTEAAAYRYLEQLRWKGRPVCPHCGVIDGHYLLKPKAGKRVTSTGRKTERRLWKCCACRKQFSVLVGTIMHGTKVPIRTWLFVLMEMCASKNGVAAREVQRKYGLTPKTAWFLTQRIREAMVDRAPASLLGTIVADEAYIGGRTRRKHGTLRGGKPEKITPPKAAVLTLVNPETGTARSRVLPAVTSENLANAILRQVDVDRARLFTDEHKGYDMVGRWFGLGHEAVNHGWGEYVRGEVSTNAAENFFSQLKRSIDGTFHAVSHEHLARYLAEFDFRYGTRNMSDGQRVKSLLGRIDKRRLTYRALTGQEAA